MESFPLPANAGDDVALAGAAGVAATSTSTSTSTSSSISVDATPPTTTPTPTPAPSLVQTPGIPIVPTDAADASSSSTSTIHTHHYASLPFGRFDGPNTIASVRHTTPHDGVGVDHTDEAERDPISANLRRRRTRTDSYDPHSMTSFSTKTNVAIESPGTSPPSSPTTPVTVFEYHPNSERFENLPRAKGIRLHDRERDMIVDVSVCYRTSAEIFREQISELFGDFSYRTPLYILIGDTPYSLDPAVLIHLVEDGETYPIGFLVLPFRSKEQFVQFSAGAMHVCHSYVLTVANAVVTQADAISHDSHLKRLNASTITSMDVQRAILRVEQANIGKSFVSKSVVVSQFFALVDTAVKELLRIADDSAWVPAGNRKNIALYRIEEASNPNLLCQKACGRVPGTTKRIKDILVDSSRQSQFNPLCIESQEIEHLDGHTMIVYNKYQASKYFQSQARDAVLVLHWFEDDDGTAVVVSRSVEHPDAPPNPSYSRGIVYPSGFIITPCTEMGRKESMVTWIFRTDMGDLGSTLSSVVLANQVAVIENLREMVHR